MDDISRNGLLSGGSGGILVSVLLLERNGRSAHDVVYVVNLIEEIFVDTHAMPLSPAVSFSSHGRTYISTNRLSDLPGEFSISLLSFIMYMHV